MPNQSLRQVARRAALDAQIRVRRREDERDKRRSRLGVIVVTALAERDSQVVACEQRAAQAASGVSRDGTEPDSRRYDAGVPAQDGRVIARQHAVAISSS